MTTIAPDLEQLDLGDLSLWINGPPHDIFTRLRSEAPVHWRPLGGSPR